MGRRNVQRRSSHVTVKRDNAASFMASLPGKRKDSLEDDHPLSQGEIENLYRTNWICRKVCDLYASDMVSAGVEWATDSETADFLEKRFRELQVWGALEQAVKLARLYGGSIIYLATQSQADLSKPIGEAEPLSGLRVFDRYEAKPDTAQLVPAGARVGEPIYYDVSPVISSETLRLHESRCLRFVGASLPAKLAKSQDLWGDSVLQSMANRVRIFDGATRGVGELMKRCYLRAIGIKDFWNAMADPDPLAADELRKGMNMLNELQSIYGLTVMDAQDTFSTQSYGFGGVKDVLDQISQQLAGACDVPLVRLYGMSPAGFSTGESDLKAYYGAILKAQESMLRTAIGRIAKQLLLGAGMKADDLDFQFIPLSQPTQAEKIATAQQGVATILSVSDAGLITPQRALQEIKRLSETTGLFTTVTDGEIKELADAPVPEPLPEGADNAGLQPRENVPLEGPQAL